MRNVRVTGYTLWIAALTACTPLAQPTGGDASLRGPDGSGAVDSRGLDAPDAPAPGGPDASPPDALADGAGTDVAPADAVQDSAPDASPPDAPPTCELTEGAMCTPASAAPGCCAEGRVCANIATSPPVVNACCRNTGGACTRSSGCCGTLICQSGTCQPSANGCTLAEAAACTPGSAAPGCCADGRACQSAGGTATVCCIGQGGACTSGAGCCGSLTCNSGVCGSAVVMSSCSLRAGASCSATGRPPFCCAGGLVCMTGRCALPM